jgi:hypothetical protein
VSGLPQTSQLSFTDSGVGVVDPPTQIPLARDGARLLTTSRRAVVGAYAGLECAEAISMVRAAGLIPAPEAVEFDDHRPRGCVCHQEPQVGTEVARGSVVVLLIPAATPAQPPSPAAAAPGCGQDRAAMPGSNTVADEHGWAGGLGPAVQREVALAVYDIAPAADEPANATHTPDESDPDHGAGERALAASSQPGVGRRSRRRGAAAIVVGVALVAVAVGRHSDPVVAPTSRPGRLPSVAPDHRTPSVQAQHRRRAQPSGQRHGSTAPGAPRELRPSTPPRRIVLRPPSAPVLPMAPSRRIPVAPLPGAAELGP